jgi:hypothetical protein
LGITCGNRKTTDSLTLANPLVTKAELLFNLWAPSHSPWSAWVKPVLFAHWPRAVPNVDLAVLPGVTWAPPAAERPAIVVELPGVESVALGLALAEQGYRPVPLFNGCPAPEVDPLFDPSDLKPRGFALVDVDSILAALAQGAERLPSLELPTDAPPAFLLDADRTRPRQKIAPGLFDNRSVVFTTDFPSAKMFQSHAIGAAIVVVRDAWPLASDLDHVLRTWSRSGLVVRWKQLDRPGPPEPLNLPRPYLLSALWIRLSAWLKLRPNPEGGYGDFVPEASAG